MIADVKKLIDIDTFINNIETLIKQGVAEINENGRVFKVHSTWYHVYDKFEKKGGMFIHLESGTDRNSIDNYCYSVCTNGMRAEASKLLGILYDTYIIHQLFNKTNIVESLKKYADIIEKCTSFEKFSENTFVLHINNAKYSFIRKEKYDSLLNKIEYYVEVTKYGEYNIPQPVYNSENLDSIQSLYSILNSVYYINKTKQSIGIDSNLFNALGLNNNQ